MPFLIFEYGEKGVDTAAADNSSIQNLIHSLKPYMSDFRDLKPGEVIFTGPPPSAEPLYKYKVTVLDDGDNALMELIPIDSDVRIFEVTDGNIDPRGQIYRSQMIGKGDVIILASARTMKIYQIVVFVENR